LKAWERAARYWLAVTHHGVGITVEDGPVGGLAIISAISEHRGSRAVDLVEQRADQRRVVLVVDFVRAFGIL
jgi:hypothetical protein